MGLDCTDLQGVGLESSASRECLHRSECTAAALTGTGEEDKEENSQPL